MPTDKKTCPICRYVKNVESHLDIRTRTNTFSCPRCGEFILTQEDWFAGFQDASQLHLLSGVLRHDHDAKVKPVRIHPNSIESFISGKYPKGIPEMGRQLLLRLSSRAEHLGAHVDGDAELDYPIGYCKNVQEFYYLLKYLQSHEWIQYDDRLGDQYGFQVLPAGWVEIENYNRLDATNPRAFVAMWFSEEMNPVYFKGIDKTIHESGYRPIRIDREYFLNKIDDEIIGQIRRSRFVVADFTGHRGGVYFEAGFALGLGIPVIWMCRENDKDNLHFDTRQYPHIIWKDEDDLSKQLRMRILALLGKGPLETYKEIAEPGVVADSHA